MNNACIHYWIIEICTSKKSKGQCKFCDKVKIFTNWLDDGATVFTQGVAIPDGKRNKKPKANQEKKKLENL